nr:MAG TPA: STRUCTURAL MAINTENANCE OF CHROMOSOMES PROTEIN [Caudoviricetes sp.]
MIEFKNIKFKNFLSYGNALIEIVFNKFHTIHISGVSGSGKSAIMDAICFALFGKPFRQSNKGSLVNNINQKDCFVTISFSKNGIDYIVERGIKPNIFKIYKNGELIPEDSKIKDYQKYLEENILGFTFISFCQVVLVGSVNFKPFMQLTSSERRNFVEEIVGIELFSIIQDISKKELSEKNNELTNINYKKIECGTKLKTYNQLLKNVGDNKRKKLIDLKTKLMDEITEYEELNDELKLNQEKQTHLEKISEKLNRKTKEAEMDANKKLLSQIKLKKTASQKYLNTLSHENCPLCQQSISRDFANEKTTLIHSDIEIINKAIQTVETNIQKQTQVIEQADKIENQYRSINQIINTINQKLKYSEKDMSNIKSKIDDLIHEKDVIIDKTEKEQTEQNLKKYETESEKMYDEIEYLNHIIEMTKDSGIKSKIIRNYLPVINEKINLYLEELELPAQFTFDENFNEKILSGYQNDLKFESFSSGERARISIALMLTWRDIAIEKNALKTNIMFLDEIFMDSLDSESVIIFVNMLKNRAEKMNENIHVLAHRQEIKGYFDCEIKVFKKDGFSNIDFEYD